MMYFADVEADSLTPTKIHCMVVKYGGNVETLYSETEFKMFVAKHKPKAWVFHNGLAYDVPVLNRLWSANIKHESVIDTMVVSKTVNYSGFKTHSLAEIGESLGVPKTEFKGDFSVYTPEMEDYCKQDVNVVEAIFNHYRSFIYDKDWKAALRLEHDTASVCQEMSDNGFPFDSTKATEMLESITKEMDELEATFRSEIGRVLREDKRLKVRHKKDGSLFSNIISSIVEADKVTQEGDEFVIWKYENFNPGSAKQRIDVLWEHGWKPFEKTKGHKEYERS